MFTKCSIAVVIAAPHLVVVACANEQEQAESIMLRASPTIGLPVINVEESDLGRVDELAICSKRGRITHVIVATGGILGIGITLHPVPIEAVTIYQRHIDAAMAPVWVAQVDMDEQHFRDGPAFAEDAWNRLADPKWATEIDAFYGVKRDEEQGDQHVYQAGALIGLPVRDKEGKTTFGSLYEITFDSRSGRIRYGALSFGGFLGLGDELFAIPWQSITPARPEAGEPVGYLVLTVDVDEDALREAGGFSRDAWPRTADQRFLARGVDVP